MLSLVEDNELKRKKKIFFKTRFLCAIIIFGDTFAKGSTKNGGIVKIVTRDACSETKMSIYVDKDEQT
jgi:hypothetical protein